MVSTKGIPKVLKDSCLTGIQNDETFRRKPTLGATSSVVEDVLNAPRHGPSMGLMWPTTQKVCWNICLPVITWLKCRLDLSQSKTIVYAVDMSLTLSMSVCTCDIRNAYKYSSMLWLKMRILMVKCPNLWHTALCLFGWKSHHLIR